MRFVHRLSAGIALLGIAAALFTLPGIAQARVHWSIGIGVPIYGPGWYGGYWGPPPPAVWPGWAPPPVVVERAPVYVQPAAPGPAPQSFWYYCQQPAGYYPYVQDCPSGWTTVPATPAGQ